MDLTNPAKIPLSIMRREAQIALLDAMMEGRAENYSSALVKWVKADALALDGIYRILPTSDTVDWSHISPEYNYMVRDSGGTIGFHRRMPRCDLEGFWLEGAWVITPKILASYRRGTVDWKDSLVVRPGYEE